MLCIHSTSHWPVSVCQSQVGVVLKGLNESGWFLTYELPSAVLHCVKGKFGYLQNPKLWTYKFRQFAAWWGRMMTTVVSFIFIYFCFFSRSWSEGWSHHERIFHLFLRSVILIDPSTESPIYVLMMSILAFVYLTLYYLFLPWYASFLALVVPSLLLFC